jgi:hypothetical protein
VTLNVQITHRHQTNKITLSNYVPYLLLKKIVFESGG